MDIAGWNKVKSWGWLGGCAVHLKPLKNMPPLITQPLSRKLIEAGLFLDFKLNSQWPPSGHHVQNCSSPTYSYKIEIFQLFNLLKIISKQSHYIHFKRVTHFRSIRSVISISTRSTTKHSQYKMATGTHQPSRYKRHRRRIPFKTLPHKIKSTRCLRRWKWRPGSSHCNRRRCQRFPRWRMDRD